MSLIQMICLISIIAVVMIYFIDRFLLIPIKSRQSMTDIGNFKKINEFNNEIHKLIEHTYNTFPHGCPFKECQKDCVLYHSTTRTTHSVFCHFLVDVGQRTILDLDSTEPQNIYR